MYCHSFNGSGVAVAAMAGQGLTKAHHLQGGITAWQGAGGEVVTT